MCDGDPGGAEAADLRIVEVHPVRQPGPLPQPADGFEVVDGAQSEGLTTEVLFVDGLGQVGVEANIEFGGEGGAVAHELGGHGERGARGEPDLDLGAGTSLVIGLDEAAGVVEDDL